MIKVIIADDEEKICELLEQLVDWNGLGFEIVAMAHDGFEVLEQINIHKPEVVITDIQMPECSGIELLERIREEKLDIDILVISGYREFDYAKKALQYGSEDYLLKPIKRRELIDALTNIRNRREEKAAKKAQDDQTELFIRNSAEKLQTKLMEDILKGDRREITLQEMNDGFCCEFTGEQQSFMTVKVDFTSETIDGKAIKIVQQKNKNTISLILAEGDVWGCCLVRGNLLLVLADKPVEQLDRVYNHIIRSLKDFAGHETVQVTIGVENVRDNQVAQAALKSSRAAMEQLYQGDNRVIRYKKPAVQNETRVLITEDFIQKLRDSVVALSEDKTAAVLLELIQNMRCSVPAFTGEFVYRTMKVAVEQFFFQVRVINREMDFSDIESAYYLRLTMCGRWSAYKKLMQSLVGEVIVLLRKFQLAREKRPIVRAKAIIEERYRSQLTLDDISGELGLNSTYFSGIFKKETGVTVTGYITRLRMEEAKKLLAFSEETIQQIAECVGYDDEKYFMRRFKKEVGITPGEYRKLYGE